MTTVFFRGGLYVLTMRVYANKISVWNIL